MAAAGEVIRQGAADEVLLRGCSGPSSSSSSASASVADQELHVLAVDDSYVDRKVIERLLRISSCKVTAVDSGKRALQYLGLDGENNSVGFNDLKVNLIMTDYSMPGMTGYELLKKIKGSTAFREIPVVVMSSENVLTRVDRCLEEGAEEFIMKPVKLSDVKRLKEFIMRGETGERGSTKVGKRKLQDGVLSSSLVEERGSTKIGKRKLQDGILSSSLVESSSPSGSPTCELALSALSSSTPTSTIPSPKRTKLETGE